MTFLKEEFRSSRHHCVWYLLRTKMPKRFSTKFSLHLTYCYRDFMKGMLEASAALYRREETELSFRLLVKISMSDSRFIVKNFSHYLQTARTKGEF